MRKRGDKTQNDLVHQGDKNMHRSIIAALAAALICNIGCGATIATSKDVTTVSASGFATHSVDRLAESAADEQETRAANSAALTRAQVATSMVSDDERLTLIDTMRICNQMLPGEMRFYQKCVCDSARREMHQRQSGTAEILPGQYELAAEMTAVASVRGVYLQDGTVTYPTCSQDPVTLRRLAGLEAQTAENARHLEVLKAGLQKTARTIDNHSH